MKEWKIYRWNTSFITKHDLQQMENRIMSAISDYSVAVKAILDQISKAVDDLVAEIAALAAKIDQLQNSPGAITPSDQALLDGIQAQATSISTKITALDAATAQPLPVVPVA